MSQAITKYKEGTEEQKLFLQKVEKLNTKFNQNPESNFVTNFQNKFNYLPISHLETKLDELFFGQWTTRNFKYQQICNELIGDLELVVRHPITGEEIIRSGAGSVVIMQDSGASLESFTNTKKKNALVMGFPKLKAECFKNAVQSLGKLFGRDLNRKIVDSYEALIPTTDPVMESLDEVLKELDTYTGDDKDLIKAMCQEKMQNKEFTTEFAQEILLRIKAA